MPSNDPEYQRYYQKYYRAKNREKDPFEGTFEEYCKEQGYSVLDTLGRRKSEGHMELLEKLVQLMIKAGINSDDYDIDIKESEISPIIEKLKEEDKLG